VPGRRGGHTKQPGEAKRSEGGKTTNGATLGFEQKLWAAADKLRGHMDAAEYKHVVLGLIFPRYILHALAESRRWLLQQTPQRAFSVPSVRFQS
jgi:type I restriction enzyme M protein